MDYEDLLDFAVCLGYGLQKSGAEIYRVEDSLTRLFAAYGVQGESFSIPNCIILSLTTADGRSLTRMKRVEYHGTDIDQLERYNDLCRRLCAGRPPLDIARVWLKETETHRRSYSLPLILLGYLVGTGGFGFFFSGTWRDAVFAGLCGVAVGLCLTWAGRLNANLFFKTVAAGFVLSLLAYGFAAADWASNMDIVVIGALMALVPGLVFTNFMRDIISGDTVAGTSKLVEALIIALAIVLGTGAAQTCARALWGVLDGASGLVSYGIPASCLFAFAACAGFSLLYNIHGAGIFFCALAGTLGWLVYLVAGFFTGSDLVQYFAGALTVALYAEIMARVRHYPATGYLTIGLFPLVPGAGIFYTMDYCIRGQTGLFLATGLHTGAIAACLAVGVLLVMTATRMTVSYHRQKKGTC